MTVVKKKSFEIQGYHRIECAVDIIEKIKKIAGNDNVKIKI